MIDSNIYIFLQARSDSSRLPGKVLKSLLGKPMIIHQLERIKNSIFVDIHNIVLLTSEEKSDDALADVILINGFNLFRGSKNNVLKRFYHAATSLSLKDNDTIVRLTGDCPLNHFEIIDEAINEFLNSNCDYLSNTIDPPKYPDGFDVEVFKVYALKHAFLHAYLKSDLEHVTPFIRKTKNYKVLPLNKKPLYEHLRLTVDYQEDFEVISKIFDYFGHNHFNFNDIMKYLNENKEILKINQHIKKNEGYLKSLSEDKA